MVGLVCYLVRVMRFLLSSPVNYPPTLNYRYRIVMLGDTGVGKTALVSQFMTSEYMHTYDASLGKLVLVDDGWIHELMLASSHH